MSAFHWPATGMSTELGRKALRQTVLEQIFSAKSGHPGGSLSLVEILAAVFDGAFQHDPRNPQKPDRDRLVLSKGHGVPALYSALSYSGYFAASELVNLRRLGHFLQGHPDRDKYPLMEASTGSLGQGVSVALGLALALRLDFKAGKISRLPRVYCVLGDGEMQEGQVWEALMASGKFRPGNLTFILDYNKGQIDGPVAEVMNLEPLDKKIEAFNLEVRRVDGHDVNALRKVLVDRPVKDEAAPLFLIADTVKGKGVSFMEHPTKWHGAAPSKDELEKAVAEIWAIEGGKSPQGRLVS
jgi:transketolase